MPVAYVGSVVRSDIMESSAIASARRDASWACAIDAMLPAPTAVPLAGMGCSVISFVLTMGLVMGCVRERDARTMGLYQGQASS